MRQRGLRNRVVFAAPAIALGGVLSLAAPATAGTLTETATIPVAATDWSTTAEIGQFDPSLGGLHDISFGLTGTLQGTIGVESLDPVPSWIGGSIWSTLTLSAPKAGQVLSVSPYVVASANLAAFDGKVDFAGKSGRTFSGLSNTQSATTTYTVGAPGPQIPTAPFIGTGKVVLPVSATATAGVSGPLDLAARTQAAAGAAVTVKYGVGSTPPGGGYTASETTVYVSSVGFTVFGVQHTAVQTRTLSDQNGDWTRKITFNPFNPKLGTLISADLSIKGDVKASLSVQDTGPTAGSYNVDQSVVFNLLGPKGGSMDSATAASALSGKLAPFRGADKFTKPFGTTTTDTILSPLDAFSDEAKTDLAFFSGSSPLSLAVDAITSLSAQLPGSADLLSSALEGAQVSLSYTYAPSAAPPMHSMALVQLAIAAVPEPGSLALLSFAVAGFGLLRRRR